MLGGKVYYSKKYCSEGGRVVRNACKALWLTVHGGVCWMVTSCGWGETECRNVAEIFAGVCQLISGQ